MKRRPTLSQKSRDTNCKLTSSFLPPSPTQRRQKDLIATSQTEEGPAKMEEETPEWPPIHDASRCRRSNRGRRRFHHLQGRKEQRRKETTAFSITRKSASAITTAMPSTACHTAAYPASNHPEHHRR
jgi:hypothetical protein